ncbi:MAG: DUF1028 domain-containing protein [Planctomycetota bacterium]|jgi:uncharacterized Ntn-hydrolase superfamily protein
MQSTKTFKYFVVWTCVLVALACYTYWEHSRRNDNPAIHTLRAESLPPVATFSIVGFDPNTKELGIAVQSKFIAVGSVVPWARAGVGAIATQSYANTQYGPCGLKFLEQGLSPKTVIEKLTAEDSSAPSRQVGIVDSAGRVATFTGKECQLWAGGRTGKNYTVQGNILTGPEVVDAMAEAFEKAKGELGSRLIAALRAGQAAGGDRRGRQSAALYIVRKGWGYAGYNDRYRDIRVDDHPEPIKELGRIYELHKGVFPQPKPAEKQK